MHLLVEPTIIKPTATSITTLTCQNGSTPSISCTFFVSSSSEVFVFFSCRVFPQTPILSYFFQNGNTFHSSVNINLLRGART
jgi:hypothetical protein